MNAEHPSKDQRFRTDTPPLMCDGENLASIESGRRFQEYRGLVWIEHNWLNRTEATALRDWLNQVLA